MQSLNPYCSGRKNRITRKNLLNPQKLVLILIVVEERIGLFALGVFLIGILEVLILIVVEERIGLL